MAAVPSLARPFSLWRLGSKAKSVVETGVDAQVKGRGFWPALAAADSHDTS